MADVFDPDEAFCVEGCGRHATGERVVGVRDPREVRQFGVPEDELTVSVDLVCAVHAGVAP